MSDPTLDRMSDEELLQTLIDEVAYDSWLIQDLKAEILRRMTKPKPTTNSVPTKCPYCPSTKIEFNPASGKWGCADFHVWDGPAPEIGADELAAMRESAERFHKWWISMERDYEDDKDKSMHPQKVVLENTSKFGDQFLMVTAGDIRKVIALCLTK